MIDMRSEPWHGRLRESMSAEPAATVSRRLTEAERDALESWLPRGAYVVAHLRGVAQAEEPVDWVITDSGLLLASLREEQPHRVRARVQWIPARDLRRVDLFRAEETCLVRLVTSMRRHVLQDVLYADAVRFIAHVDAVIAAAPPLKRRVWSGAPR
jgi:hypothetical protein